MEKGIVFKGDGIFDYCGWPTVARIDSDTLAVAFSGNRLRHVCTFGRTMVCYSYDDGKTWSKPITVVNTKFDDRDGGIVANGKQVLVSSFNNNYAYQLSHFARHIYHYGRDEITALEEDLIKKYVEMNEGADESDVGASLTISEDGGKTFLKRIMMPISSPHGPKVLSDGRYVWVGHSFSIAERYRTEGKEYNFLPEGIYYSFSNDGYNWTEPQKLPVSDDEGITGYYEPDVVELKNGELMVHIRVHKGESMYVYQTVSSQGKTSWSKPIYLGVEAGPSHLFRHSSGKIICSLSKRYGTPEELVMISDDEGVTWSKPYVLDDMAANYDMGYPSTVELKDGRLMTVYYQHDKKGEKSYLKYTVWSLDELK